MNNTDCMVKAYGPYLIYSDGRVYSTKRKMFLHPGIDKLGYYNIGLYINGVMERYKLHRLVAMMFIPNPDNKPHINHIDGDKRNCDYRNLEWCTPYENNLHARNTGLNNVSESNRLRWENEDFRKRTSANMKAAIIPGSRSGRHNSNFKYEYIYEGRVVTTKELQQIFNLSEGQAHRRARLIREGKPCEWEGIVTVRQKCVESIDYPVTGSTPEVITGGSADTL